MLAKTLRDDQAEAICRIREAVGSGERRIVVQGPTGMGKGLLIADIVDRALIKDKRVLITVPAISLVDQTIEVLAQQGMRDVGAIQGQHPATDWSRPVQVASVQTLIKRWADGKMPKADVVLIDEVHRWFQMFPKWLCNVDWQKAPFIGFSATPWTRGLGAYYGKLIIANTIDNLIGQGVLVPFRTFAPDVPDLSGVTVREGDFAVDELEVVMKPKKLVANIVDTWLEKAKDRPTVCFCCTKAHAAQVAEEFAAKGVGVAHVYCDMGRNDRAAVRRRMLSGEVKVVCNVEIVGVGVDWPEVSCIIYARPTQSDIRFVQNVGRGLRSHPGKRDLLILDHSSTTMRLGMVNEVYAIHRDLDDGKPKTARKVGVLLPKPCEKCAYLKAPKTAKCPNCGHVMEAHAEPIAVERGSLREIKADSERVELLKRLPAKEHVFAQLLWWATKKGYKEGWAANKYREIFGVWPRGLAYEDKLDAPVPELLNFIYRSAERWKRGMAYARSKERKQHREERMPPPKESTAAAFVPGTYMREDDWKDFQ